jgi:ATP-dependent Clp protease ATP-binding subunit ClpA
VDAPPVEDTVSILRVKRYLQRELETRVARALISGEATGGGTVRVRVLQKAIAVEVEGGHQRPSGGGNP